MDEAILDEREFSKQLNQNNQRAFLKMIEAYEKKTGKKIHQMSPSHYELKELLDIQESLNRVI